MDYNFVNLFFQGLLIFIMSDIILYLYYLFEDYFVRREIRAASRLYDAQNRRRRGNPAIGRIPRPGGIRDGRKGGG